MHDLRAFLKTGIVEPTSALDIAHQVDVLALVHRLSQERGLTVIAVLHDINMAATLNRDCPAVLL